MSDVLERTRGLARLFRESFRAADIAESLLSFDAETPCHTVRRVLDARGFVVAGVRERGVVTGLVLAEDLDDGLSCGTRVRRFEDADVIPGDASLDRALQALEGRNRVFVRVLGEVSGIITWSDVQKPQVRMWLFGLVTLLELAFDGLLESHYPEEGWRPLLSAGRLRKAEELRASRRALNPDAAPTLASCLQLSDKAQILLREQTARTMLNIASREDGQRRLRRLARLRDGLAHAQDIVTDDWPVILGFAKDLDGILAFGSAFAAPPRAHPRRSGDKPVR